MEHSVNSMLRPGAVVVVLVVVVGAAGADAVDV